MKTFIGALLAVVLAVAPARAEEQKKSKTEARKELVATAGLYLGRVVEVDSKRRYVYVKPLTGKGSRTTFYLDRFTILRQERKPVDWDLLVPGRRVGIRFVREEDIAYAEGVFLVVNEVNPREFEMPKKKRKKVEKEGEEKKDDSHQQKVEKSKAFSPAAAKKAAGGGHH